MVEKTSEKYSVYASGACSFYTAVLGTKLHNFNAKSSQKIALFMPVIV